MVHEAKCSYWKIALTVAALLSVFTQHATGAELGFGQEDYTQMEDRGFVEIEVIKLDANIERIVVEIVPLTFDEFASTPGLVLPPELVPIVDGVDPAELDGSRIDFDNTIQQVIFPPSQGVAEQTITINLIDDVINEAQEGFHIAMIVTESGPSDQITFVRNGVALIRITDNDPITIGFALSEYSVAEDSGIFQPEPVSVIKEAARVSEQVLTINLDFIDNTANSGVDYIGDSMLLTLNPEDASIQVPITIISDNRLEGNEIFLGSLSTPNNPPSGLGPSMVSTATITIIDDVSGTIGFVQSSYTVSEGVDAVAEVCFRILSPPQSQIDPIAFALVNVDPFEDTAQVNEDYSLPAGFQSLGLLDASTIEDCRTVNIINDATQEGRESFIFRLTLSGGQFDVVGNFEVTVPTAEVVILDDDGPSDVVVQFDPVDYQATEGALQSVAFRITAQTPPAGEITVLFSTIDGSAVAPGDYVARTDVQVVFAAGETEQFVEVAIEDDNVLEDSEAFMAVLSLPVGSTGVVLDSTSLQATAIIEDDDVVTVAFNPETYVVEEGQDVVFVIQLIGQAAIEVQINFETADSIATAPDDYTATFEIVTINPGEVQQSVLVSTVANAQVEANETFEGVLTLLAGSSRINLMNNRAMATIVDTNMLILSPSPIITAIEGESIEITCGPLGAAIVDIIIEVNTVQVSLPFQDINMQRMFTFGPVDRSQQGTAFRCVDASSTFTTNTVTLEVFYRPEYNISSSFIVNEGDVFNLPTLNLDANPIPGDGNFSWTFNGQPLVEQPGVIELGVNSILLTSVLRSQSGVYMITSSNSAGTGQASFALNVYYAPTYMVDERFTPTEGFPFRVDLGLDANPIPGIGMFDWTFNGQPINLQLPGVDVGVNFLDFGNNIQREASGNYTVTSFNDASSGNASFVIDVYYIPEYNISSTVFNVTQGETFDLELNLDANPFPQNFVWFFNGLSLPVISGIELGVNFIRIQMVTQLDSGTYTVQASNAVGTGMISFMLQVEVPTTTSIALPNPSPTVTPSVTDLPIDRTRIVVSPTPSPDTGMGLGGDPHFSILLPNGQLLCFSVQGEHGFVFNLISNKIIHMNAKFIPDSRRSEVTWIGSLGMVVRSKKENTTSKIRFEALNKMVYVDDRVSLRAQSVKKLTFAKGKLTVTESDPTVKKAVHPQVEVDLEDVGIAFTVRFVKEHIDMVWNKVRKQPKDSHGIIGQFFRDRVEIDELRRLLVLPEMEPVAVMRKPVWHFMEREEKELDQFCWVAMNPGYQGKKLIQGHYLDYLVDDVLSSSFRFRPGTYRKNLEELLSQ